MVFHMYPGVARIGFVFATVEAKKFWAKCYVGSENHKTVKNLVTKLPIKILRPLLTLQPANSTYYKGRTHFMPPKAKFKTKN